MAAIKLGIVSLGLIGGSILKSLSKEKNIKIYAVTRNPETIEKAKNYTQFVSNDMHTLKCCDIIFVCSPMNKTLKILDELELILPNNTVVADVCSLKEFVMQKEYSYKFIGTHPMAGTENSGFDASFDALFEDAKWVITPHKNTEKDDIQKIKTIIERTKAKPITMPAKEHDKAVALISHMPMILSQALMNTVIEDKNALTLASSGFRDMTRLAMSNTEMAKDMVELNSNNISDAIILFMENTKSLLNSTDYKEKIEKLRNFRSNMYNSDGKNIYNQSSK